ncbi:MAG TPA: toxic anion resistance protein [Candidatus Lustribacter sp.]|nr:toxic anion resistance protein [Candidatus Lustribacter sp.]
MEPDAPLEPPALTPPAPVAVIAPQEAANRVPLPPAETTRLDGQVGEFIGDLTTLDPHGSEFKTRVDAILALGEGDIRASASVANRMLERPMNAMKKGVYDGSSPVSKALGDLRDTVESLDPSKQGDLLSARKILGIIPFGNKLKAYFDGYRSAQNHLNAIIEALYRSKDELQRDNASIEQEKAAMWALMQKLEGFAYLAKKLDAEIDTRLVALDTSDPERAKILREDVQFYARQKIQDLLTQMAVNVQGYLALDLIKKNNVELIKGVERATTTTVSALRTAVVVAQALANEKLVLNQIGALNTTTGNMIESTSAMLKQQSAGVYEQAASATIDVEKLKAAFKNVYDAMDSVSTYKAAALTSMQQTVTALEGEVQTATAYLERTKTDR